jgi:hypothetical protein
MDTQNAPVEEIAEMSILAHKQLTIPALADCYQLATIRDGYKITALKMPSFWLYCVEYI